MNKASISYLREAFSVKRYHTVMHVAMPETVGHHTCQVLAMLFYLFDDHPPLYLVRHALHHDAAELVTGDIPATAKWKFPAIAKAVEEAEDEVAQNVGLETCELDPQHRALLKFADMMDLCFKAVEELSVGNDAFQGILANGLSFIGALLGGALKDHQTAHELYKILLDNKRIDITVFIEEGVIHVKH